MSQENVEIVRRVYEAPPVATRRPSSLSMTRKSSGMAGAFRKCAWPRTEHVHGHAGLQRVFRGWDEAWESFEDECERLIDAGDRVISVVTRRARGRTSGAETTVPRAGVWTIREGKVARVVWFPSVEEALVAVRPQE